ncbi:hypothetical protein AVEN_55054-1, partial [Araneus ventricosus]
MSTSDRIWLREPEDDNFDIQPDTCQKDYDMWKKVLGKGCATYWHFGYVG